MEEKFYSVYDLIATHRNRWTAKEAEAKAASDYNGAQSYVVSALIVNLLFGRQSRHLLEALRHDEG